MLRMPTALRFAEAPRRQQKYFSGLRRRFAMAAAAGAVALSLVVPAWAGDPFRTTNPQNIDNQTEAAFRAIFEQGNYTAAADLLRSSNPDEPLAYAMKASLAYLDQDWDALGDNATLTREAAERLVVAYPDSVRGHLYTAVGHFLEGAHTLSTEEAIRATPAILGKLQQVFDNLEQAENNDSNDPELNLLKGYMDLMLAVNLPFSNPQQAIERLQTHAKPDYLAQRGIAVGYRDLNQYDQALEAVDRAIATTPGSNNPDLFYLKAQILAQQSQYQDSLGYFQQARAKQDQLPRNLAIQIAFEECRVQNRVNRRRRDCDALRDQARESGTLPPVQPTGNR
jgi:tetratricopeptide (TPR) repeat protein